MTDFLEKLLDFILIAERVDRLRPDKKESTMPISLSDAKQLRGLILENECLRVETTHLKTLAKDR